MHKAYISFKTEDLYYKRKVQELDGLEYIDQSLNEAIGSTDDDYVLRRIREEYLHDSTVTILLIGQRSAERLGQFEQRFIKGELQASLYQSAGNSRSGILGVVLPEMTEKIFGGISICLTCGGEHSEVRLNRDTVIDEFTYNFYIPNGKCSHPDEDRYCILAGWEEFTSDPEQFIDAAFDKRAEPIAGKVKVRPRL